MLMSRLKRMILQLVQQNARRKVAILASEYVRAKPEEREAIQAGIEIERWLAEVCEECLSQSPEC
jgi:hypothetical protein